jgi:hypothetical protein
LTGTITAASANFSGTLNANAALNVTGSLSAAGGIYLNNSTSNLIYFGTSGFAAPGAASTGEKIQLYGAGAAALTDYAIGINTSTLWFNVPTAGQYQWDLNGVQQMVLASNGYLGIGSAAPGYSLDVTGTGHFSSTLTLADGGTYGSAGINGSAIGGVTPAGGAFTTLASTYSANSALNFQVSNQNAGASASAIFQGSTNAGVFYIQGTSTAGGASTYLNTTINGPFYISATGSLGQIIFSTGATPSTALTLAANRTAYFAGAVVIQGMASAATTSAVCINTSNGLLTYDGTIGTCNTSSDRFKHDIEPVRFDALEAVMRMQPVTFFYDENQNTPGKQLGFVAERLDEIDPLLVGRDAEGKANSIRFLGPMFAYVIGSEQQMQNEILELRQKVARLEAYLKH